MRSDNDDFDNAMNGLESETRKYFAPLTELETPPGFHEHLREAMASQSLNSEMEQRLNSAGAGRPARQRSQSFWRRSVSIPLPVVVLMFVILMAIGGRGLFQSIRNSALSGGANSVVTLEQRRTAEPDVAPSSVITKNEVGDPRAMPSDGGCVPKEWSESIVIAGLGSIVTRNYISCERLEP